MGCNVPFSGVPYDMVRMDFQSWGQTSHRCRLVSSAGPGAFGGVLRSFYEVRWNSLGIFHHPHNLPFVLVHFDNLKKTKLLLGLTQLITLKVAFREEYLTEHLSVISRWNLNEKIYRMGWLDVSFSDWRRHGG